MKAYLIFWVYFSTVNVMADLLAGSLECNEVRHEYYIEVEYASLELCEIAQVKLPFTVKIQFPPTRGLETHEFLTHGCHQPPQRPRTYYAGG